jgi:hypothetical protein
MDTDDGVAQSNKIEQPVGHSSREGTDVYPDVSELAAQAFQLFVEFTIDMLVFIRNILVQSAVDAGNPEMAEQIRREFLEAVKSNLSDKLPELWDAFGQLWPQLQPILCEIEGQGLKIIDLHWSTISEGLNLMRDSGYIGHKVSNEEIIADMLQGEQMAKQVPPGHPLLCLLGVKNDGEWTRLTPAQQWLALFDAFTERKQAFSIITTRLLHRWAEDLSTSSVSQERLVYSDEVLERIEAKSDEPFEYLNDSDRLSQFCELGGIEMNTLTDGESSRILDILHAQDAGYDFASKEGVSMQAYYGDRADSEKTQRQRLFKKIREASDKAK